MAVKVLHPEYREDEFVNRFKTEARTAVRLTAPNIVRVYDFNAEVPYLVMEYCGEGDLNGLIKRRHPMPLAESLGIVRQICSALVAAHENQPQILHRDLKPGNVLFQQGVPKVADFGLAKMVGSGTGQTTTRGVMGTVRYCSPEQLRDASRVDHRADLWSVGIILYEMLTWMRPFDKADDTFVNIALRVHTEPPRQPPFPIPPPVWKVIDRALQKNPDDRFRSAREMIAGIDEALRAIPDASSLTLPPESALDEVGRLAAEVATLVEQGRSQDAESRLRQLRKLAPEDSLSRYWHHRIKEVKEGAQVSSSSSVETVDRERVAWLEKQFASVQSLIQGRSYREARRLIGEILVSDPDNTIAQRWLDQVNEEERRLREDLEEAHRAADAARRAGDLEAICAVWSGVLSRWKDLQEAQAELAVATREREMRAQKSAREEAKKQVGDRRAAGDLRGALEAWRGYMRAYPQDREAPRLEVELSSAVAQSERAERLAGAQAEGSRLEKAGDLAGALALWRRVRQEDPDLAEAAAAVARLESEIARRERARQREAAAAASESRAVAGDFVGAAAVWEAWLATHADDAAAVAQRDALRGKAAEQERAVVARELESLVASAEKAVSGGRFASAGPAGSKLAEVTRAGRAGLSKGAAEIQRARRDLQAAFEKAEEGLRQALQAARADLLAKSAEAQGSFSDGGAASASEEKLRQALVGALAALTRAGLDGTGADPVAVLKGAASGLGSAQQALDRERRDAIASSQKEAKAALDAARAAFAALEAALGPDAGRQAEPAHLKDSLQRIAEQAASRSPERVMAAASAATALRSEIEAIACRSRFEQTRALASLVSRATMLLPVARGGKLGELLGRARTALEAADVKGKGGAGDLAQAREILEAELASQGAALEQKLAAARERWKKALGEWTSLLSADLGAPQKARADAMRLGGESALAAGRADQLEAWAARLEALSRRYRVESAWIGASDGVLETEGALDSDGLPAAAADPETRSLLERFRAAAGGGDAKEMSGLAPAFEKKRRAAPARSEGPGEPEPAGKLTALSARARRANEIYNAEALKSYDALDARHKKAISQGHRGEAGQIAAELARAQRRLISPPPAWKNAIPAVAAAVVVIVAVWLALPQGAAASGFAVRVMSPKGAAVIRSVTRDGSAVSGLALSVSAGGELWSGLAAGRYEVTMDDGARTSFTLPGPGEVLLPTDGSGYTRMLKEALDLDRLAQEP